MMGAIRWMEQDSNTNIDISGATLIGSYTCDADRLVFATLYAQGLAGGGDYVYYATVTPSGLSEAEVLKTTQTLGATTYTLFAQTIGIALRNGDVLKIYIDGLAGDDTTPDTRVNFFEDGALQPITAGRTLDVSATGEVTVSTDSADDIAEAVWDSTSVLTTVTLASPISGGNITVIRGDTFSVTISDLAANTGYVSIDFTVKKSPDDSDDDSILRIRKNASGLSDGLLRMNGAALVSPITSTDGSITVNSATSLTIALTELVTEGLGPTDMSWLYYDIQYIFSGSVQTAVEGYLGVHADITLAIE